jgi:hypothetical protein
MERIVDGVLFVLAVLIVAYFGALIIGVLSDRLDARCLHFFSWPPTVFWAEGNRVTCD